MKITGDLKEKCPKASTFGLEIVRFQILHEQPADERYDFHAHP